MVVMQTAQELLCAVRPGARVAIIAFILNGCAVPAPETVSTNSGAIVNGVVDNGHPAVGIVHSGAGAGCTGTLIEPDKVLTAAHCVLTETKPYEYMQPVTFILGGMFGDRYTARAVAAHPLYAGGNRSDVAVLWLKRRVNGVTPRQLAQSPPYQNEPITIVGYGWTGENQGQFGTKRKASNKVQFVQKDVFTFTGDNGTKSTTCSGDSGGPTFATRNGREVVLGVHSTSEQGCNNVAVDMRVDTFYPWITTQQVTKRTYGELCQTGDNCLSSLCIDGRDGNSYCTLECDSKACPRADECVAVSATGVSKACVPHTGGNKKLGETCAQHDECETGVCVMVTQNESLCTQQCTIGGTDCPGGYACFPSQIGGLCIKQKTTPPPPPPKKKKLGEDCTAAGDCESNICAMTGAGRVCIELCDPKKADCPSGFECQGISGSDKGACIKSVPKKKLLGDACKVHDECIGGLCASFNQTNLCTQFCEPEKGCPQDVACVAAGADKHVCNPLAPSVSEPDSGATPVADMGVDSGTTGGGGSSGCVMAPHGTFAPSPILVLVLLSLVVLPRRRR